MSAQMTLAGPEHLPKLLPLVAAFHAECGFASDEEARIAALEPLLAGSPYGTVYLIGPPRAPIGYIVLTFGWSVEFGGLDGFIDELFIRPAVRRRGIATEVLAALPRALAAGGGLNALHLEVRAGESGARKLYQNAGFRPRDGFQLMTRTF